MSLFSDGNITTISDLRAYETAVLDVASNEGVDLATKVALAQQEVGVEVAAFLARQGERVARGAMGTGVGLGNVVVTPALRQWHTFHALSLIYRDLYNNQLNDRYEGKWKEYSRLAKQSSETLLATGAGIVEEPVGRASLPEVGSAAVDLPAAMYFVQVAWLNGKGEEGSPGEITGFSTSDGQAPVVRAVDPPPNAAQWNVYMGSSGEDVRLQNETPIAAGASWTLPPGGLKGDSRKPGEGQSPDRYVALSRILRRG